MNIPQIEKKNSIPGGVVGQLDVKIRTNLMSIKYNLIEIRLSKQGNRVIQALESNIRKPLHGIPEGIEQSGMV